MGYATKEELAEVKSMIEEIKAMLEPKEDLSADELGNLVTEELCKHEKVELSEVPEEVQAELLDFSGIGSSIIEISHRDNTFKELAIKDFQAELSSAKREEYVKKNSIGKENFNFRACNKRKNKEFFLI